MSFNLKVEPNYEKMVKEMKDDLVKLREEIVSEARNNARHVRDANHAMALIHWLNVANDIDVILMKSGCATWLGGTITEIDGKPVKGVKRGPKGKEAGK